MNLIEKIDQRFRSGNLIPIERAHVTADEWQMLRSALMAGDQLQLVLPSLGISASSYFAFAELVDFRAALSRIKGE